MILNHSNNTAIGKEIYALIEELFPICRSITGHGVRETLSILQEYLPLQVAEIPSGTEVFDWTVPREWNIRDAYILDPQGRKVVDFRKSNLHVVGYSVPVRRVLSLGELRKHLHSLPDQPDAIPYLTSYYEERWGFCISHRVLESLLPGEYTAVIDSTLEPGSLTYADAILTGETSQEILLSTNVCHPSMANNELSGPIVAAYLYQRIAARRRRFTYRFVFVPETIGAIAYLSRFGEHLKRTVRAGYTLLCLGMTGAVNYKRSRRGDSIADTMVEHILRRRRVEHEIVDFQPWGSDERQYCSPGFNLPVGSFRRREPAHFAEYHTSLDNKGIICFETIADNVDLIDEVLRGIEAEERYVSRVLHGEPWLSKRGLAQSLGSQKSGDEEMRRMLHVLNFADGEHTLRMVADRLGCSIHDLVPTAERLLEHGLIRRLGEGGEG